MEDPPNPKVCLDADKSEHFSDNVWVLYDKACELASKQKYDEAISYYDKALEINAKDSDALFGKRVALYVNGKRSPMYG